MSIAVLARNVVGAPLAGLTPTWLAYLNAVTGAAQTQPGFTDIGLGHYRFDPTASIEPVGMIDLGAAATPRYVAFLTSITVKTVAVFDEFGAPLVGASPVWASLKQLSDGANLTQPAITALGNGLYKTTFIVPHATGVLDFGVLAFPRYLHYDSELLTAPTAAPVIGSYVPIPGTLLDLGDTIQLDVTDTDADLASQEIIAYYDDGTFETVWNGSFAVAFTGSTRTAITNGFRFVIGRVIGWPSTVVVLEVRALDSAGNLATDTNGWPTTFVPTPVGVDPPIITIVSPAPPNPVGETEPIVVRVVSPSAPLRRVFLYALFTSPLRWEVIHAGGLTFGPAYVGNTRVSITNGFEYNLLRNGGWPSSPKIDAIAISTTGVEGVAG
jgi:hypothetical protein